MKIQILVVEDDDLSRLSLVSIVSQIANVKEARTAKEAIELFEKHHFDLAFLDLDLEKELAGLNLIAPAKKKGVYSVVLSGREEDEHVAKAYHLGCEDYLIKPFTSKALELVIRKFELTKNQGVLREFFSKQYVTQDEGLINDLQAIKEAIISDRPVLLTGETGTGKTMVAKLIHELQYRTAENFVHLSCAELPENLLESELFGYEKGAFTGAEKKKRGLLEMASGGTLFLDEVATMPMGLQKKFLRVIEEKSFYPLGSEKKVTTTFRLITATCDDLKDLVERKEFREDLFFRIEGFNIHLKPLKERRDDIPLLLKHFMQRGVRRVVLSPEVSEAMYRYSWPGNVRQLSKVVELLRTKERGVVSLDDLPPYVRSQTTGESPTGKVVPTHQFDIVKQKGLPELFNLVEEEVVEHFFTVNEGKVRQTLKDLQCSNATFYRVMERIKKKKESAV